MATTSATAPSVVSGSTPLPAGSSSSGTNGLASQQIAGNFQTFLQLLTTQLQNQNPLDPLDTNQFTQQLVEYSQVEQQIDTNTSLQSLISQGTSQAGIAATTYLGRKVSVTNGNASLTSGQANWSYTLGTQSAATQLTVTDPSGKVVYTGAGSTSVGNNTFNWNGQDNNGNQLSDGTYKLTVTASASDGSAVTTSVASAGTVSQIDMTSGTPQLVIGNMEVAVTDIAAIAN